MDNGMVCSPAMLVMGDEVVGMTRRFMQGIPVNAETLAREVIAGVGPGGHYLQDDHTYRHFREQLWMPGLLTRQNRDTWLADGGTSLEERVQARIREIVESHAAPDLPGGALEALAALRRKGAAELAALAD
jgi:trimethylamine--corrinoid protein Co-methyltransferase